MALSAGEPKVEAGTGGAPLRHAARAAGAERANRAKDAPRALHSPAASRALRRRAWPFETAIVTSVPVIAPSTVGTSIQWSATT